MYPFAHFSKLFLRLIIVLFTAEVSAFSAHAALTALIPDAYVPWTDKGLVIDLTKYIGFPLPQSTNGTTDSNNVLVSTSEGNFVIQLFPTNAPLTVANFVRYVTNGSFDNTFFHRSVSNFVIQTGGYQVNGNLSPIPALTTNGITNEFGISNTRGTVAMALTGTNPNSATDQWFINLTNNSSILDNTNTANNPPFTVFGKVLGINGMKVVDKIAKLPTDSFANFFGTNTPLTRVPLQDWNSNPNTVTLANLVTVSKAQQVSLPYLQVTNSDTNSFSVTLQGTDLIIKPLAPNTAPATISITATDTNGNAATPSFQISTAKLYQTINFPINTTSYSPNSYNFSSYPVASSGLGVNINLVSGPAYVKSGKLYLKGTGTVIFSATQSGTFFYAPASAKGYLLVDRATQTISFPNIPDQTNAVIPSQIPLITTYPSSSSQLPVSLTLSGPAKLKGRILTLTGAGTVTLLASQPGNANYYAAKSVTNSFVITPKK